MELFVFTALGFITGLILRAGREEEAYLRGIAIGRRRARAEMTPPFPDPLRLGFVDRDTFTALRPIDPGPISTKPRRRT